MRKKRQFENLEVTGTFMLTGSIPKNIKDTLVEALMYISEGIFFDDEDERVPRKDEIKELDKHFALNLEEKGLTALTNFRPFENCGFKIDLAVQNKRLLIEIEKGKLPRLELDIIKILSACKQFPSDWQFGALVVPSSYIDMTLAAGQTPFVHLKKLKPIVAPLSPSEVRGLIAIGYKDPR